MFASWRNGTFKSFPDKLVDPPRSYANGIQQVFLAIENE